MELSIDLSRAEPAWQQIADGALDRVASGHLTAGVKLPSVRALARSLKVNPNTVARAYRELEVLGAVEGRQGRGVFVTEAGPALARDARGNALARLLRDVVLRAQAAGMSADEIRRTVEDALPCEPRDERRSR